MMRRWTRTTIALGAALLLVQDTWLASAKAKRDDCGKVRKSEVKLALDPTKAHDALGKLGVRDKEPDKARSIYFFDTCDLQLAAKHVIFRARVSKEGSGETTAKLRQDHSPKVRSNICKDVKCEEDRSAPDQAAISCSFDRDLGGGEISIAVAGGKIAELFSTEQIELVGLDKSPPPWERMRAFGPIASRTWKDVTIGRGSTATQATIEEWTLPGETKAGLLEVSQRVERDDAKKALGDLRATLVKLKVAPATDKSPKTAETLKQLSRNPALCPAKPR
jgi:uncharacterized protein YjbK